MTDKSLTDCLCWLIGILSGIASGFLVRLLWKEKEKNKTKKSNNNSNKSSEHIYSHFFIKRINILINTSTNSRLNRKKRDGEGMRTNQHHPNDQQNIHSVICVRVYLTQCRVRSLFFRVWTNIKYKRKNSIACHWSERNVCKESQNEATVKCVLCDVCAYMQSCCDVVSNVKVIKRITHCSNVCTINNSRPSNKLAVCCIFSTPHFCFSRIPCNYIGGDNICAACMMFSASC